MKKTSILIGSLLLILVMACETGDDLLTPTACLKTEIKQQKDSGESTYVEATQAKVGEEFFFTYCGDSDYAVIYPGDSSHVLPASESDTINFGFPMTDQRYSYKYTQAGQYTATLLATNVSTYNSRKDTDNKRATTEVTITVIE